MRKQFSLLAILLLTAFTLAAHPMPRSVMLLDVKKDGIAAELRWPLKEFQVVFPREDIDFNYTTLISRKSQWLNEYLLQHFSMTDSAGNKWQVSINNKSVTENEQPLTGPYHELVFYLWLQPPAGASPRHFVMHYDAIMHQVVTHNMLIKIARDWYGGLTSKDSAKADVGVLSMNLSHGAVPPVIVNLDEGSFWKGFTAFVHLGIDHIAGGTDHLLFLLVLLLPATLVVVNKRWGGFGGWRYSIIRLLKIITAFTAGHSVSLLVAAMKWLTLPQQPVEVAIAFTILITAIHAIRPLFYGKEVFIATGFGLIHGLAFATVLSELNIDTGKMLISVLGFNIGIELMQLFVVLCTVPWLIVLSKSNFYHVLRIAGACCAIVASLAWIIERVTNQPNAISGIVQQIGDEGKWLIAGLALLAIGSMAFSRQKTVSPIE